MRTVDFQIPQETGVDRVRGRATARVWLSVERFESHFLHQPTDALAVNYRPLELEHVAPHAASGEGMLQMQLITTAQAVCLFGKFKYFHRIASLYERKPFISFGCLLYRHLAVASVMEVRNINRD